ncbi:MULTISPECIES: acyl-CoA thioesterase [Deinococcus]|uniref:Acyl-CoA thioesterase n=1 Tax=Deinococcus cavernae TaxID=2320857 RepID=A0A418V8E1_9DEIO|nr:MULTISPECIES: thioesterase family protein [Deinococcus]RJF72373.1 acyl-CoA thioesterase [Deinococcus cavernae]
MSEAPTPKRLQHEFAPLDWSRAHRTPIQMRYSDTDALGHVNNAAYVQYLETSRVVMLAELQGGYTELRSVVARLELDYVRELRLGQEVVVETLIGHLGTRSMSFLSRIVADGVPCAFARVIGVGVDEHNAPVPLPASLRTLMAPFLAGESA